MLATQLAVSVPAQSRLTRESRKGRPTRVLVVDDSSDGRRTISNMLGCLGVEVAVAENGRVACDLALGAWQRQEAFDLVLMDIQMPGMDGCEAAALLRSKQYGGRIVGLLTNGAFAQSQERCTQAGCDGSATKPITFALVRDLVRTFVPQAGHGSRRKSG